MFRGQINTKKVIRWKNETGANISGVTTRFEVKNDYEMKLRERLNWVMAHVSRRHNVQMTLVTTFGLKYGIHCGIFQRVVTLDSLFEH